MLERRNISRERTTTALIVVGVMLCASLYRAPLLNAQDSRVPGPQIFHRLKVPFGVGAQGIAARAADNVWTVNGGNALHFDGTSWSKHALAMVQEFQTMYGPAVITANDVWSVGFYPRGGGLTAELVEHWDGTRWSVAQDLSLIGKQVHGETVNTEFLTSVTALSSNDVWAAGWIAVDNAALPFVEHFDGKEWSLVANITNAGSGFLQGIAVVSDSDVWAVGVIPQDGITGQSEAFHFDGKKWRQVNIPQVRGVSRFNAVAAISSDDVWAVGYSQDSRGNNDLTLTEHWNGKKWLVVPSPNPANAPFASNFLNAVAAVSSEDVWTAGYYEGQKGGIKSSAMHWDGSKWRLISLPPPPRGFIATLFGVAALPSKQVWLGGGAGTGTEFASWILFTDQGE
jgi:hypothetical protein